MTLTKHGNSDEQGQGRLDSETVAKNQRLAGSIAGKSSLWSRMARIFLQPIDAPPLGLLPEPERQSWIAGLPNLQ